MFLDHLINNIYEIFSKYSYKDLSFDEIKLLDQEFKEIIKDLFFIRNLLVITPDRVAKFNACKKIKKIVFKDLFDE